MRLRSTVLCRSSLALPPHWFPQLLRSCAGSTCRCSRAAIHTWRQLLVSQRRQLLGMPPKRIDQIRCDICKQRVKRSSFFLHRETCCAAAVCEVSNQNQYMGVRVQQDDIKLIKFYVSGIRRRQTGGRIMSMYLNLCTGGCPAVRTHHQGRMFMIGWGRRASAWLPRTFVHKRKANAFLRVSLQKVRAFKMCLDHRPDQAGPLAQVAAAFPNFVPRPIPSLSVGGLRGRFRYGACMVVSRNYVARRRLPDGQTHDPPPQVVAASHGRYTMSCQDTCLLCRGGNCVNCDLCCLHVDDFDESVTFGCAFQQKRLLVHKRAWLVLGNKAFEISGGLAWAMWGKTLVHGIWQDPGSASDDEKSAFYAVVWVHRMREDFVAPAAPAPQQQARAIDLDSSASS